MKSMDLNSHVFGIKEAKMQTREFGQKMRVIHRYLGFFLGRIMAMYAISGIILVFRSTDFLKTEIQYKKNIGPNIQAEKLGSILKIKGLKVDQKNGDVLRFKNGEYNQKTGQAMYTKKDLPYVLDKMTKLHKANTNTRLYALNIFFGFALLFFVISSFWMFMPSSSVFKKGMIFTVAGILLTLLLVFL